MTIANLLRAQKKIFSFEFFPPKDAAGAEQLYRTIDDLRLLDPAFVSVTYGAMGTNQDGTLELVKKISHELQIDVMAHFTCVCAEEERVRFFLQDLAAAGITNVLALRGDIPEDTPREQVFAGPFQYASDLVNFIRSETQGFTVCVAGYPEKHIEALSLEADIESLKKKVDAGADAIITQLFFMNDNFYRYCDKVRDAGITVPIIPGIMPVQSVRQIAIFSEKCGVKVPDRITDFFSNAERSSQDGVQFGIDYAIEQCRDLLTQGVPGIHFYTLNKSKATREIFKAIKG